MSGRRDSAAAAAAAIASRYWRALVKERRAPGLPLWSVHGFERQATGSKGCENVAAGGRRASTPTAAPAQAGTGRSMAATVHTTSSARRVARRSCAAAATVRRRRGRPQLAGACSLGPAADAGASAISIRQMATITAALVGAIGGVATVSLTGGARSTAFEPRGCRLDPRESCELSWGAVHGRLWQLGRCE